MHWVHGATSDGLNVFSNSGIERTKQQTWGLPWPVPTHWGKQKQETCVVGKQSYQIMKISPSFLRHFHPGPAPIHGIAVAF